MNNLYNIKAACDLVKSFMGRIRCTPQETQRCFELYNIIYNKQEHRYYCVLCYQKAYDALCRIYNEWKDKIDDAIVEYEKSLLPKEEIYIPINKRKKKE